MKAVEWVDRVKSVKGIESDYKAAQVLGITRGGMSQIRNGGSHTLNEETALKVAQVLSINPAGILLDQAAERIKDTAARSALLREVDRFCIMLSVE